MRVLGAVLLVGVLAGCTSVKMVQRDGCWVRRTEKRVLGTVAEEVGPCARPAMAFVDNDPLTRMVQECVSRADYRWQMRALAAWDRREPWPEQLGESSVLQECLNDSARSVLGEAATLKERNAALEQRLADLAKERERSDEERRELVRRSEEERKELFRRSDEERKELLALQTQLGEHLGAAARKVQPVAQPAPAIATATASSEGRSRSEQADAQPATLAVVTPASPAGGPVTATATMVPGGASAPVACVVAPEPAARAETPKKVTTVKKAETVKKATPSRQARVARPAREARKAPMTAVSNLPACDPNKVPVKVDVPAAKVAEPSAPNVEAAKTEPATAIAQPR